MKRKKKTVRRSSRALTVSARARKIRMLLMDVDGVLTDGRILFYGNQQETKSFDVKDGVALHLARRAGLLTGIITGRQSEAVRWRAQELAIDEVHQKALDKLPVYRRILARQDLRDEEVCYIGDDWVDIPVLRRVGLAVVPADADPEAARHAHLRTRSRGGRGAIRETVELILRAQGKRQQLLSRFLGDGAGRGKTRSPEGSR
jgi:3-deoxy-D-manno-octulosonate 8-phosphate phosphatase (KDO 8-P phosphatase)